TWETIIKLYRNDLKTTGYDSLCEYAASFMAFLQSHMDLFPVEQQDRFFDRVVGGLLKRLWEAIDKSNTRIYEKKGRRITDADLVATAEKHIVAFKDTVLGLPPLNGLPPDFLARLQTKYANRIKEIRKEIFENYPFTPEMEQ